MKILSKKITNEFKKRIINIHPSLLPKFKGLNTYSRVLKNKEKKPDAQSIMSMKN